LNYIILPNINTRKQKMNFITKSTRNISLEEAVCYLKNYKLLDAKVKACMPVVPDVIVGSDVTFPIAMSIWMAAGKAAIAADVHPVVHVEKIVSTRPVSIAPDYLEYKQEGKVVREPLARGYVTEPSVAPKTVIRAHVADSMSYAYTAASHKVVSDESHFLEPNFSIAVITPQSLMPAVAVGIPTPEGWCRGKAVDNRDAVYETASTNMQLVALQSIINDNIAEVNRARYKINMTKDQVVPNEIAGYSTLVGDRHMIKTLFPFFPPMLTFPEWDLAYRFLSAHRARRGEDKSWISPLTVGYYWGSIPSFLNKVMWKTADILHVLRLRGIPSVYFYSDPDLPVAYSLVHNGYIVYISTNGMEDDVTTTINKHGDNVIRPGVYYVRNKPEGNVLTILDANIFQRPLVMRQGVDYPHMDKSLETLSTLTNRVKVPIFVHGFLSKQLCDYALTSDIILLPSIHAHAGSVIITSRLQDEPAYPHASLLKRMCHANSIKTWFPFSRYRMLGYDNTVFKFVNFGIAQGMILSMQPKLVERLNIYDSGIIEQQLDSGQVVGEVEERFTRFYAEMGIQTVKIPVVMPPEVVVVRPLPRDVVPLVAQAPAPPPVGLGAPPPPLDINDNDLFLEASV
jgi:hypothetical protein